MYCRKCGYEIPDDSVFCLKCGTKVKLKENNDAEENKEDSAAMTEVEEEKLSEEEESSEDAELLLQENSVPSSDDTEIIQEEIKQKDIKPKLTKRQKVGAFFGVVITIIIIIAVWQDSLLSAVRSDYDSGDYEAAYSNMANVFNKEKNEDYKQKVEIMYNVNREYQKWQESKYDTSKYSFANILNIP